MLARVSNTVQQAELSLHQSIAGEGATNSCALHNATPWHEGEGQSGAVLYPCKIV